MGFLRATWVFFNGLNSLNDLYRLNSLESSKPIVSFNDAKGAYMKILIEISHIRQLGKQIAECVSETEKSKEHGMKNQLRVQLV